MFVDGRWMWNDGIGGIIEKSTAIGTARLRVRFADFDFAGSEVSGCLGRVVSLARVVDQKGLIGVEVLQGSGSRIDERSLRLDHSRCSQLAAVNKRVAVREGFSWRLHAKAVLRNFTSSR